MITIATILMASKIGMINSGENLSCYPRGEQMVNSDQADTSKGFKVNLNIEILQLIEQFDPKISGDKKFQEKLNFVLEKSENIDEEALKKSFEKRITPNRANELNTEENIKARSKISNFSYLLISSLQKNDVNSDRYFNLIRSIYYADSQDFAHKIISLYRRKSFDQLNKKIDGDKALKDDIEREMKIKDDAGKKINSDVEIIKKAIDTGISKEFEDYFDVRISGLLNKANADTMFAIYALQGIRFHFIDKKKADDTKKLLIILNKYVEKNKNSFIASQVKSIIAGNVKKFDESYFITIEKK